MTKSSAEFFEMWYKYVIGVSYVFLAIFCNGFGQVIIEKHWRAHTNRNGLFDVGFEILPRLPDSTIADYTNVVSIILGLVTLVLFHSKRGLILRRAVAIQGSVYFVRAIALFVTILPNPDKTCKPSSMAGSPKEILALEALKVALRQRITCGDVMFSGHACIITLNTLLFNEYAGGMITNTFLRQMSVFTFWLMAITSYFIIIATRFHYTIDVFMAIFVTTTIFKLYHYLIKMNRFSFLTWYESDETTESSNVKEEEHQPLI